MLGVFLFFFPLPCTDRAPLHQHRLTDVPHLVCGRKVYMMKHEQNIKKSVANILYNAETALFVITGITGALNNSCFI